MPRLSTTVQERLGVLATCSLVFLACVTGTSLPHSVPPQPESIVESREMLRENVEAFNRWMRDDWPGQEQSVREKNQRTEDALDAMQDKFVKSANISEPIFNQTILIPSPIEWSQERQVWVDQMKKVRKEWFDVWLKTKHQSIEVARGATEVLKAHTETRNHQVERNVHAKFTEAIVAGMNEAAFRSEALKRQDERGSAEIHYLDKEREAREAIDEMLNPPPGNEIMDALIIINDIANLGGMGTIIESLMLSLDLSQKDLAHDKVVKARERELIAWNETLKLQRAALEAWREAGAALEAWRNTARNNERETEGE